MDDKFYCSINRIAVSNSMSKINYNLQIEYLDFLIVYLYVILDM